MKRRSANLGISLPGPLFSSPRIVMTPGAHRALRGEDISLYLERHFQGDWGEVDADDASTNNESIKTQGMILSAYRSKKGERIWVITDPGHEVTTILLPEEY